MTWSDVKEEEEEDGAEKGICEGVPLRVGR